MALTGASDGISVGAVKIVIGLHKNRLKYAPYAPLWGARVERTTRKSVDVDFRTTSITTISTTILRIS